MGDFNLAMAEAQKAIAVSAPLGEGDLVGRYHAYLALYEIARGQHPQAAQALDHAQRILGTCQPTMWTNNAVDIFACIAFDVGADALGVRWLAHSDKAREGLGLPRRPVWQNKLSEALAGAQLRLGKGQVLADQAAGGAMRFEAAIAQIEHLRALL